MRKNILFTFIFACVPGAGQMYLGYRKQGVSMMLLLLSLISLASALRIDFLMFFLPVVWFYSFFDTFSIRNASAEELAARVDCFVPDNLQNKVLSLPNCSKNFKKASGLVLVSVGAFSLYNSFVMPIVGNILEHIELDLWWLWDIFNNLPTVLVSFLIIIVGIYMLRGRPVKNADDVVEYKGDLNND